MICDLIDLWIAFAVASNIWETVFFARIGPEIRGLAHIVLLIAARQSNGFCYDQVDAGLQGFVRFAL